MSVPGDFQAHLNTGTTTLCWCWRIERADGVIMGFTDHDRDLTFAGLTYESETGLIATELRTGSDLAIDAQDATGVLTSDRITETDIIDGRWDNATVEVYRVNWADPAERSLRRKGSIGQIRRGRVSFTAEIRSLTHVLGQTIGRTYQASCDAAVGDSRCGVNLEAGAYKGTGAIATVTTDRVFTASGLGGFASGWFAAGLLTWTSGLNAGRVAEVAIHELAGGVVTLTLLDLPILLIEPGDGFTVTAGCNKSSDCVAKFANIANFRGFPTIPPQESVMRYASKNDANEGTPL